MIKKDKTGDYWDRMEEVFAMAKCEFGHFEPDATGTWYSSRSRTCMSKDGNKISFQFEEKPRSLDYKLAFHLGFLAQQGLEPTRRNIQDMSLPDNELSLLYESDGCWIVLHDEGDRQVLNLIWKDGTGLSEDRGMESIEL